MERVLGCNDLKGSQGEVKEGEVKMLPVHQTMNSRDLFALLHCVGCIGQTLAEKRKPEEVTRSKLAEEDKLINRQRP